MCTCVYICDVYVAIKTYVIFLRKSGVILYCFAFSTQHAINAIVNQTVKQP